MKEGSKYHSLYRLLVEHKDREVALSFDQIEQVIQNKLPPSAYNQKAWWSNRASGAVQATSWMGAGYHVVVVDMVQELVTFRKPTLTYTIKQDRGVILWDGEMIKGLRRHLGYSQVELADLLGIRQQTISEWETNRYYPTRATSKHLALIAERVRFKYQ